MLQVSTDARTHLRISLVSRLTKRLQPTAIVTYYESVILLLARYVRTVCFYKPVQHIVSTTFFWSIIAGNPLSNSHRLNHPQVGDIHKHTVYSPYRSYIIIMSKYFNSLTVIQMCVKNTYIKWKSKNYQWQFYTKK